MAKTKFKRGTELRVIERKDFRSKRGVRSDYRSFENFRRDLMSENEETNLIAFSAGRILRRQWHKANAKLRVTFGAGKRALDSFIRISCNGRVVFDQTI